MDQSTLPIEDVLPQLLTALESSGRAVLQAPPGAGKTTRVPIALLDCHWLGDQRIIMLEPRRVAARAAANRLAETLGETVGDRVGYRMRHDTVVSARTRIEVVTEGVLTRLLQADPSLAGIGIVVFDEFHERSLHADLGLALTLEARAALRPDLRLLLMSATLDGERAAALLDNAPIVTSHGRQFDVHTEYHPPVGETRLEEHMAAVIAEVAVDTTGDILAFLPGAGWIRRTQALLSGSLPNNTVTTPLYGLLSGDEQDRAIRRDPEGRRKVVLATDIAETSVTIEGVAIVVDGGQHRSPRFDPRSGLTRLETKRISKSSADQRRGRAGRLGPGRCYRLWSQRDHQHLEQFDPPEIANADLSGLRLQLGLWGTTVDELAWLDRPPEPAVAKATDLLSHLGALDPEGRISTHGRAMADIGADPRLGHMLITANDLGLTAVACDVAGLLSSRDPLMSRSVDLRDRLLAMHGSKEQSIRWGAMEQARTAARRWRRAFNAGSAPGDPDDAAIVVALAFGDRIAKKRGTAGSFLMSSGRGAILPPGDALSGEPFLAVAEVDGEPQGGRIYLAAPLRPADLEESLGSLTTRERVVSWDENRGDVVAENQTRLGALVLKREPIANPPPDQLASAWAQGVASEGLALLEFPDNLETWRGRIALLRRALGDTWPDLSDTALLATTADWLAPHLSGVRRRRDLRRLDIFNVMRAQLTWNQLRDLDDLAPTHISVPSGSSVKLDYTSSDGPVLAVRLQELFGLTSTPTVARGQVPVVLHLLSPAGRPVQVTTDLANFWAETYTQVKAELMGRYPKHHWPTDPLTAEPTARTKKRR